MPMSMGADTNSVENENDIHIQDDELAPRESVVLKSKVRKGTEEFRSRSPKEVSMTLNPSSTGKFVSPDHLVSPLQPMTTRETRFVKQKSLKFKPPMKKGKIKSKNPLRNKFLSKENFSQDASLRTSYYNQKVTDYSQKEKEEVKGSVQVSKGDNSDISSLEVHKAEEQKTQESPEDRDQYDIVPDTEIYKGEFFFLIFS